MLGRLSIALLLAASPALANEPAPAQAANPDAAPQEYTIKKVCQTYEVAGSMIPRRSCVNRKIPVKKPASESQESAAGKGTTGQDPAKESQE